MSRDVWRDLVYAGRSLAKARAFTFVCIVSLGIGMAPVIAIPYGTRVFTMPPPGVNTQGLVEVIATPGVGVGLILTALLIRLNGENMGISLSDVESLAYVVGAAIAILVAVFAGLAPARRAASVLPMVAMRSE